MVIINSNKSSIKSKRILLAKKFDTFTVILNNLKFRYYSQFEVLFTIKLSDNRSDVTRGKL